MQISLEVARDLLREQDNFFILTHKNPDGDTLGSAAALCCALRACGKRAFLLKNPGATERYSPWIDALLAPSDAQPGCILAVDTATSNMLPESAAPLAPQTFLTIDHHVSHREFAAYTVLDAEAAACGEIIWRLIALLGVPITREIAEAIYIAISTDTSCFLNSNTTADTHRIAAELYPFGVRFELIHRLFFIVKSRARLALEAALIQGVHFYHHGEIAVMHVTLEMQRDIGATEDDLDNISSLARSIDGVEVGILVREIAPNHSKISMRSGIRADVSRICAHFGGGGHVRAAGCSIALSPAQAEEHLLSEIEAHKLY